MSKIWKKITKKETITQQDFFDEMNALIAIGKLSDLELKHTELSMHGGACPLCKKMWQLVEVRTKAANYDYYIPTCECFEKSKDEIDYIQEEVKFNQVANIPLIYHKVSLKNVDKNVRNDTVQAIEQIITYAREERYLQKGLILFGDDSGTGKTMLTICLMKRMAIKHKKSALFVDCSLLDTKILNDNQYLFSLLDKDIVLLDDIDKSKLGRSANEWSLQNFFTIINCICENKKTLFITSNIDTKEKFIQTYSEFYKDKLVSRLIESCEFMRMAGNNYRMKDRENLL